MKPMSLTNTQQVRTLAWSVQNLHIRLLFIFLSFDVLEVVGGSLFCAKVWFAKTIDLVRFRHLKGPGSMTRECLGLLRNCFSRSGGSD